jgi:hypothetical protein
MNNRNIVFLITVFIIGILYRFIYAETSMNIILSIELPDSLEIKACENIGDFNADGYDDLLVGVWGPSRPSGAYQAAYLYYGGSHFDGIPDLEFKGDMCMPLNNAGRYGEIISGLGDFNGDGIDDIAIGAQTYNDIVGRIYIYYGSATPDTTADIILNGQNYYDGLPFDILPGDYNGDGLGDFLTGANNPEIGPRMMIYLGGEPPDTIPGIIYDYTGHVMQIFFYHGSSDINGDGIDDYGWTYWENAYNTLIYLGFPVLNQQPEIDSAIFGVYFLKCDVSGDGIDDLIRTFSPSGESLCLGGNPPDIIPDQILSMVSTVSFHYTIAGIGTKLITDIRNNAHEFRIYNIGFPFDTIPIGILDYGHTHYYYCEASIGDINFDGIEEIALPFNDTTSGPYINIYQITFSGISNDNNGSLPDEYSILSCYPNPFNSSTTIIYRPVQRNEEKVAIEIYDILGQLVRKFDAGQKENGCLKIIWDAKNEKGQQINSGIYFIRTAGMEDNYMIKLVYLK